MARIYFYAGPSDNQSLKEFIYSLGLRVYEGQYKEPGVILEVDAERYSGLITFLEPEKFNPYSGPDKDFPYRISNVTDPMIWWSPSYTVKHGNDNYIIHGDLEWEFNDPNREEEAKLGKQYFGKISRWIRKNWPPPAKRDTYRGAEAQTMIQHRGYIPRGLPPRVEIEYIQV